MDQRPLAADRRQRNRFIKRSNKTSTMSKTLTQTVTCKHCGATTVVEKQNIRDDERSTGGVTSKMCRKCGKQSQYNYRIQNGQFSELN